MTVQVKVKTVWGGGMVSVSTPYVDRCLRKKQDLEIICKGAKMIVPVHVLSTMSPREVKFNDHYGRRRDYSLYDFSWRCQ